MSPDKLFDYLDGKLSPDQREKVEQQLVSDPHARRELAAAREIHSHMRDTREVLLVDQATNNRGAILGRRVATAFAILVFLNVVFGLYAIGFMKKKEKARISPPSQNQQPLVEALEKAAAAALPTPSFEIDEIKLEATAKQREAMASKVIAAANQSGGSAVKGLSNENGILVFAEIPTERVNQFRDTLQKLGATLPASTTPAATNGKAILQIRIVESAK